MTEIIRHCPDCGWDRPYSQLHPAPCCCQDSGDDYCAEWFCVACGTAVILGGVPAALRHPEPLGVRDRVA